MNETNPPRNRLKSTVPLLLVSNLERSLECYRDGLGFELKNQWERDGTLAWVWLQDGGAALMLQQACENEDPPPESWGKGMVLYFICDDAERLHRDFIERGIGATEPSVTFYRMKQTHVTDPDGYHLCFESQVSETS